MNCIGRAMMGHPLWVEKSLESKNELEIYGLRHSSHCAAHSLNVAILYSFCFHRFECIKCHWSHQESHSFDQSIPHTRGIAESCISEHSLVPRCEREGKRVPCRPTYTYNVTRYGCMMPMIVFTCSDISISEGGSRPSKTNRSAEAVSVSISVMYIHTYIQTKVQHITTNDVKATEFYRSMLKPWNVMAIKRIRIQCVPGALFPSLSHPSTRLMEHYSGYIK